MNRLAQLIAMYLDTNYPQNNIRALPMATWLGEYGVRWVEPYAWARFKTLATRIRVTPVPADLLVFSDALADDIDELLRMLGERIPINEQRMAERLRAALVFCRVADLERADEIIDATATARRLWPLEQ